MEKEPKKFKSCSEEMTAERVAYSLTKKTMMIVERSRPSCVMLLGRISSQKKVKINFWSPSSKTPTTSRAWSLKNCNSEGWQRKWGGGCSCPIAVKTTLIRYYSPNLSRTPAVKSPLILLVVNSSLHFRRTGKTSCLIHRTNIRKRQEHKGLWFKQVQAPKKSSVRLS